MPKPVPSDYIMIDRGKILHLFGPLCKFKVYSGIFKKFKIHYKILKKSQAFFSAEYSIGFPALERKKLCLTEQIR